MQTAARAAAAGSRARPLGVGDHGGKVGKWLQKGHKGLDSAQIFGFPTFGGFPHLLWTNGGDE
jgi:hypothetical protein